LKSSLLFSLDEKVTNLPAGRQENQADFDAEIVFG
jgi:hypothetical protein